MATDFVWDHKECGYRVFGFLLFLTCWTKFLLEFGSFLFFLNCVIRSSNCEWVATLNLCFHVFLSSIKINPRGIFLFLFVSFSFSSIKKSEFLVQFMGCIVHFCTCLSLNFKWDVLSPSLHPPSPFIFYALFLNPALFLNRHYFYPFNFNQICVLFRSFWKRKLLMGVTIWFKIQVWGNLLGMWSRSTFVNFSLVHIASWIYVE